MYTALPQSGGTNIQASRAFRGPSMGMLTVYQYGFQEPAPPPPPTPWGTYILAAVAGWWAWTKWVKPARAQNPRRRRHTPTRRRRRNPDPRKVWRGYKMGERVRVGKSTGVIVGQPTGVWSFYRVKLDSGPVRDYALRSVRPA